MRRGWISFLLAVALLAAACSKPPPARVAPAAAPQQPEVTTIRMAVWPGAEPLFGPVITAFQDKHPEYRVETIQMTSPTGLEDLLQNRRVDLIPNTLGWEYLIRTGKPLVNLDAYVAESRFDPAPFGPLLEHEKVSGRLCGLPLYGYPSVIAYSKRLVAETGVTIPTDTWTWEEFRYTAARLTRGSGDTKIWGFDWFHTGPNQLAYLMALQKAPAGGVPDRETLREVLSFFAPMVRADQSMPPMPTDFSEQPPPLYCDKGRAALCLLPLPALSTPAFADFGMAPFPTAPRDKPAILANVASYAITAAAEKPEAAWALLSFMAGPEGSLLFAKNGQVPVYSNEANRQAWLESAAVKPQGLEMVLRAPWYVPPMFTEHYSPYGAVVAAAEDVLSGIRTVDEAMENYDAILKKSK